MTNEFDQYVRRLRGGGEAWDTAVLGWTGEAQVQVACACLASTVVTLPREKGRKGRSGLVKVEEAVLGYYLGRSLGRLLG